jgi:hypothetical protein
MNTPANPNKSKNTVVFVEPRVYDICPFILNHFVDVLGEQDWHFVFYCGKNTKQLWEKTKLYPVYEIRELETTNFSNASEYSDFMKSKTLWESLQGEFVLTAQMDTWIFPQTTTSTTTSSTYTIDDFIKTNKSYIGGNMCYDWQELHRENISCEYKNFNGGLSLRKRLDMIRVIENFPPQRTLDTSSTIYTDAEDVYFTVGCYKLGLPVGDDEYSSHFAIHTLFKESGFGIHKPYYGCEKEVHNAYPHLKYMNRFI